MFEKLITDLPVQKLEEYPFPLYKLKYTPKFPKKELMDKLHLNTTYHRWQDMIKDKPGIQSEMKIVCPEINDIIDTGRQMVKQVRRSWKLPYNTTIESHWIYMSGPDNPWAPWHKHEYVGGVEGLVPQWTYVFYAEMPENLEGTDGRLYFREDHNPEKEYWILPEEDSFLVFPSLLDHKPEIAPKSAKSRVVMAGNYFFDNN
jgi:hypothetical protein